MKKEKSAKRPFPLFAIFTGIYLLFATCAVAGVDYFFSTFSSNQLVKTGETNNVSLADNFARTLWPVYGEYVKTMKPATGEELRSKAETARLRVDAAALARDTPVLKLKMYNLDGLTVYSSQESQMGESKLGNRGYMKAARAGVPVSKTSQRGEFSAFSGAISNVALVETYVPVRNDQGVIEGVFELYSNVTDLTTDIAASKQKVIAYSALALLIGYLLLSIAVWRGDRLIKRSKVEVSQRAEQLSRKEKEMKNHSKQYESLRQEVEAVKRAFARRMQHTEARA